MLATDQEKERKGCRFLGEFGYCLANKRRQGEQKRDGWQKRERKEGIKEKGESREEGRAFEK